MSHATFSTPRPGRHWGAIFALGLCCLAAFVLPARGQTAPTDVEYRIKAAYLYNFTKFIEWPPQTYAGDGTPFVLGVIDPKGEAAETIAETLAGKTTPSGRPIEVRRFGEVNADALAWCHQLFVTRGAGVSADLVRELTKAAPLLVVGETDGFAEQGGVIGLVLVGDRVRCEVNLAGAERAGLKLSGRLASISRLVRETPPRRL